MKDKIIKKLKKIGHLSENTYLDKARLFRIFESIDNDTGISIFNEQVLSEFDCRVSFFATKGSWKIEQGLPYNENQFSAALYCKSEIDINSGDKIEITRDSESYLFIAAKANNYFSHKKVLLKNIEDMA